MFTLKNMKKYGIIFLSICVFVCALGCWIGVFSPSTSTEIADAATYDSYYANLNENLTGTAFRAELASLITSTHRYNPTYDGLRNIFDENELTKDKALKVLIEAGAVEPLSDSSGFIYTDKNGMIYTL